MKKAPGGRMLVVALASLFCYLVAHFLARGAPGSGPLQLARLLAAFPLVFFVPGAFWLRALSRRREIGLLEFLVANMGISSALLIALTILLRLGGAAIGRAHLLALDAACLAGGYAFFSYRGGASLRDDLSPRAGSLTCLALSLAALYAVYRPYFDWGLDRHWVVTGNPINPIPHARQITKWEFPKPDQIADVTLERVGGAEKIGERFYRARAGTMELLLYNRSPSPHPYTLAFFFQSRRPLGLEVALNANVLENLSVGPMIDVRCAHLIPRGNRLSWMRRVTLAPGENTVRFRIGGAGADAGDLMADDFSNLTKEQFLILARGKYLFGEIGEFYDNIEVVDFSRHFFTRCFTYTDDLRPGIPGYSIVIPPLDFHLKMFFLALGGNSLHDLHLAYFGQMVLLYLILLLYFGTGEKPIPFRYAVLPLFVILAEAINMINFRLAIGHDAMMCAWFLAAAYFLMAGNDGLFLLFAAFTCLTRNHGILFILLAMLSYRIFYGEGARLSRILGRLLLLAAAYLGGVAALGHATGVLRTIWVRDFMDENYRFRFAGGSALGALRRGLPIFTAWVAVTSCAQCFLLVLRKDRVSRYLLLPIAVFYPITCMAKFFKPYYLVMFVFPASLVAVRILAQLSCAFPVSPAPGKMAARAKLAALLYVCLLIAGAASVAYLAVRPLVYPEFTTLFPRAYFRLFGPS